MSEQQPTPWFVNGEKPARRGVYNVSCSRVLQSGKWWSYWNGRRFLCFSSSKDYAEDSGRREWKDFRFAGAGDAVLIRGSWRGLASDPKAKP